MKFSRAWRGVAVAVITVLTLLVFAACDTVATEEYFDVFGTTASVRSEKKGYAESVREYMQSAELVLSATVDGSDISRINSAKAGESVVVDELTMEVLLLAHDVYVLTDGAYDPSVYPLVELWGFSPDKFVAGYAPERIPTAEEIAAAMTLVGFDGAFSLDAEELTVTKLKEGAKLDVGGIAKGYIVEKSISVAEGETLVNLGGNIGGKNGEFTIGVGAPRDYTLSYVCTLALGDGECVSTSGDYERYYELDGVMYHHIIDPRTGYPADSGLASATVVTTCGGLGDALSTAIVVAGEEKGREWLETLRGEYPEISAVFVTPELEVTWFGRSVELT